VKRIILAALGVIALLAIAGCGSSSSSTTSSGGGALYGSGGGGSTSASGTTAAATTSTPAPPASAPAAIVSAANNPGLKATIIVNSKGFTLYDFHKDKGTKSACYGACAKIWPPLISGAAPKAEKGAEASKLGTTKRTDGTLQVTYAGHPLYTYVADKKPGDTTGNDFSSFGAQWYALKTSGEEAGD
jgi:predicted lipoprotein with Yx(FWY)xxD motif